VLCYAACTYVFFIQEKVTPMALTSLIADLRTAIPGLAFRPLATTTDYAGMLAVRLGSVAHDQIDTRSSREGLPDEEDLRVTFPAETMLDHPDLLLVAVDDQVIGYNHVLWRWTEVSGVRVYLHLGYLLPAWRNKGIGSAMLRWAQQRIRAIAAIEQADERATFATNVSSTEVEADALILHAGYSAVHRLSDMAATISADQQTFALPAAVELRPVEPEHYRAIYQANKDAYREVWTSTMESDEDYVEFLSDYVNISAYDPALWHVAWVGDSVVGSVISQLGQNTGAIVDVTVRKAWQRQGIARALLQRALQEMRGRGVTHARLYTDAANAQGARGLYESVGFREVKQHIFYRRLLSLPDIS
jgi:mycothiol synthase